MCVCLCVAVSHRPLSLPLGGRERGPLRARGAAGPARDRAPAAVRGCVTAERGPVTQRRAPPPPPTGGTEGNRPAGT